MTVSLRYRLLLTAFVVLSGIAGVFTLMSVSDVAATEAGHSIAMIADARLQDQNGNQIKAADLEDKLVLMNFFFTGCEGACPIQTSVLRDVRGLLKDRVVTGHSDELEILFLSVSIAPYTDTKQAINSYIEKYNLGSSDKSVGEWKFAKADVKRLKNLIEHFGVTLDNAVVSDGQLDHRNMGYLFGKRGKLMQQYQLIPGMAKRLAREIASLDQIQL